MEPREPFRPVCYGVCRDVPGRDVDDGRCTVCGYPTEDAPLPSGSWPKAVPAGGPIAPGVVGLPDGPREFYVPTPVAAPFTDEQLPARIATWIARIYKDEQPTDRQVRMVLAALTALSREETT